MLIWEKQHVAGASLGTGGGYFYSDDVLYAAGMSELDALVGTIREDYGLSADMSDKEVIDSVDWATYHAAYSTSLFDLDIIPKKFVPKPNILSFESAIGDAVFEGENTQYAPAWKLLTCQGEITKVDTKDTTKYNFTSASYDNEVKEFNIPQIDVKANYTLEISTPSEILEEETPSDFVSETDVFLDGTSIKLIRNDVMVYAEEVNTQLLTENFDVEVYEMIEDTGVLNRAGATLHVGTNPIAVGDTITIGDGIRTETFEFIDNTDPISVPAAGNIGVRVSNNYELDGSSANRKGYNS